MRVTFVPLQKVATVGEGETVLDAARRAGAPIGSSCGGVGVCGRCRVQIVEGADSVSSLSSMERRMADVGKLQPNVRLACQAIVRSDVVVTTEYW